MTAKASSHMSWREESQKKVERTVSDVIDESNYNASYWNNTLQGSYITYFFNRFKDNSPEGQEKRFNENSEKAKQRI